MLHTKEEVIKAVCVVAEGMKLDKKVRDVICREDYEDYQVVLEDTHHCEIRDKVMGAYITSQDKESFKEIKFALQHAAQYSEWERLDSKKKRDDEDDDQGIVIDDDREL